MRSAIRPRVHLFVCANQREGSPLGPGCGNRGEEVYAALKAEVSRRSAFADVWVTKTHCLGICPKRGCTVARWGNAPDLRDVIVADVEPSDAPALIDGTGSMTNADEAIAAEIDALEALQRKKVLDLA